LIDLLGRTGADEDEIDPQGDDEKGWKDAKQSLGLQEPFPFSRTSKDYDRGKIIPLQPVIPLDPLEILSLKKELFCRLLLIGS